MHNAQVRLAPQASGLRHLLRAAVPANRRASLDERFTPRGAACCRVGFRNKMSQSFLQARAAFQHFDTSGDGALDKDEIREALAWMKMDLTYFDDMSAPAPPPPPAGAPGGARPAGPRAQDARDPPAGV